MKICIGAPVFEREWSLPRWLQSVFKQGIKPKDIIFIFGITDGEDNTRELLEKYGKKVQEIHFIDCNDLDSYRDRNPERFYPLAEIRNRLLEKVREINPDFYFSWDTDIILPDKSLLQLIEDDKDLVSPYVELVKGIPNCVSRLPGTDAFRREKPVHKHYPKGEFYKVDASFACLLFQPQAYDTMYGWHQGGEDYAAALSAEKLGLEFWMDSRIVGDHLFTKDC
jgi:hypothetical protein